MKTCPKCNIIHYKSGIFCSRACANSRGPRTEDFKNKVRSKLKGKSPSNKGKIIAPRIKTNCYICNIELVITEKAFRRGPITCRSIECKKEQCRNAGKSSAKNRVRRSKDEIELFDLCKAVFPDAISNSIIVDGWDADIVIPSTKTAILWNGPWHYKEMNMTNHSLKQVQTRDKIKINLFQSLGWKVFIFEDRYYTPSQAFIKLVGDPGYDPSHQSVMSRWPSQLARPPIS